MKSFALLAFALAVSSPAFAQQQQGVINFMVTVAEAQKIINAVGTLPWNDVNTLQQKLIGEANAQLAPPAPSSAPVPAQPAPAASPPPPKPSE